MTLLCPSILTSQVIKPKFENISVKDGLPENSAISILQDHLGFMWFGTQNGLVRYDGYKMKVYPYIPNDSLSLSEGRVSALYEDKTGILWAGTLGGLNRFDRVTEKFKRFKIPSDTLSYYSNVILSICEDNRGNFWIGTRSGLYLLDRKKGKFKSIYFRDRIYTEDVYNYLSDLIWKKHRIQGILNAGDSENLQKSFKLKKRTPVLIVMMGEDGNDYGYLKNSRGRTIYTYDYNSSVHAGGLKENRIQIMIDTLAEGSYTLHYKSNYSYSYQDGFTSQSKYYQAHLGKGPSHPENWGIQVFDISNDVDKIQKLIEKQQTIFNSAEVFSMIEGPKTGKLYIGTFCQGLWELDDKGESIVRSNTIFKNITSNDAGSFRSFCKAKNGSIWIASSKGVLNFNPIKNKMNFYTSASMIKGLEKEFSTIVEDDYGTVWAGSAKIGMFYLDQKAEELYQIDTTIYPIKYRFYDVLSSCIDKSGVLWVGTWVSGIEKWDRKKNKLTQFDLNNLAKEIGSDLNVISICEDHRGTVWLGTDNGLVSYDRHSGNYFRYFHDPDKPNSLSNDDIYCLMIDMVDPDILWISTHAGLNKYDIKNKIFECYKIIDHKLSESSLNDITFIHQGRDGKFWISSRNGPYLFDKKSGTFSKVMLERLNETERGKNINYLYFLDLYEDNQNILWPMVTGSGLIYIYPSEKKWKNLWTFPNGDYYISATAWCEDTKNNLWIGDYTSGLHLFNLKDETSINYSEKAGVTSRIIISMVCDDNDNIWVLSDLGLTRFNPLTNTHSTFFPEDGLVDMKYWFYHAFYKNSRGEIFICGTNGFNAFHPDSIKEDPTPPDVVIDKISLFNKPDVKLAYKGFISEMKEIVLPYNQNDLHFEYVGLHYAEPLENKYRYMLEGFDRKWVNAGTQRTATYTNLDPGKYVFRVKAANRDGIWNEAGASLTIIIKPPLWATTWAYLFYILVFTSLVYYTWKLQLKRIRVKNEFEMSRFETQKLQEVDKIKTRFFTNISHEFRTPLTLILGPSKQLSEEIDDDKMKTKADFIHRSTKKLNKLVDELLDISKIESGEMKLKACQKDIVLVVKETAQSFISLAERKNVTFTIKSNEDKILGYLDKDKIDKILSNVLSNAFKFTPEGGKVEVQVNRNEVNAEIMISDTGTGIPKSQIDKIFDRFYQVDSSYTREHEGTGIGLALTKELVELHKGRIEVESEEGRGSTFRIIFPLGREHLKPEEIREEETGEAYGKEKELILTGFDESAEPGYKDEIILNLNEQKSIPNLLIIEDNPDVRKYISMILGKDYKIFEAKDGEEGLARALECIPDLIISDIMMPKMDGFQLCSRLKTDPRTSHIPVIMLTAKATLQDKISGLETGADEYLMKPFEEEELMARIRNLLEQRKRLHEHFRQYGLVGPDIKNITSVDQKFIQKAAAVINEHISDTSFSVEKMADILAVSRSLLEKKLEALSGETPVGLIRRTRLTKAAQLIKYNSGNISEIAFEVGFSNPSYFAECFKKQFGVTPSSYKNLRDK